MGDTSKDILDRVYAMQGPDDAERVYDEWAARYDDDTVAGMGYVGPAIAAAKLVELARPGLVLDAGCGTGLVGVELAQRMATTVDGVDISPGMLDRARVSGVYRKLERADLTRPLEIEDDSYDAAICVGTFTAGHVGPEAFGEMARVVRPGGHVVATVLDRLWESGGYRAYIDALAASGGVRLLEADVHPYREVEGVDCRLCVLEIC
ncbi:MAG: class I SAM-dependent DNA methyltransferase [Actinomycetes bacterium]